MKLAVIGGGSTYTPELADGLARMTNVLSVDELVLVDPARDRTARVAAVSQRIVNRLGASIRVHHTDRLDEGVGRSVSRARATTDRRAGRAGVR